MMGAEVCVVTGGRGFVGRHLVLQLLQTGRWIVRITDLAPAINLTTEEEKDGVLPQALESGRAQYVSADLRSKAEVIQVFKGAYVVFHMAAPDSSINNFKLQYSVNVIGTRNVIDACIEQNVKKLIYTSSASVVLGCSGGIHKGDESLPYADKHYDIYSETKAQAEDLVLSANGRSGLVTCALRPSGIFGPGDRLFVPSLITAAKSGKLKFIIGDGENMYDFTYVENVAHAHICAEQALVPGQPEGSEVAAGKSYFITNMEPYKFWDFVSQIVEGLGYKKPGLHLPVAVVMPLARVVELVYKVLGPYGMPVPQFTPSRMRLISCSRTFDCHRAHKLLGYKPIIPLQEGIRQTIDSYSHLKAQPHMIKTRDFTMPSKAERMLGGGKTANILLWKNERQSFVTAMLVFGMLYYFYGLNHSLISATSRMLLLATVVLSVQKFLPPSVFGFEIPRISASTFVLSEGTTKMVALHLRSIWNGGVKHVKEALTNHSWGAFFKVVMFAQLLKYLGRFSMSTFVGMVAVGLFTAFYIYDQKEEEIDELIVTVVAVVAQCKAVVSSKLFGSKASK